MSYDDEGVKSEIKQTKKKAKWGCLLWGVILIFGPILIFVGKFYYEMEIKEKELLVSPSPDHTGTIEIVEKGEAAWFGPSSVRLKFGHLHFDTTIRNDGKMLDASNVQVEWKDDHVALITLDGEEQQPETYEFNKLAPTTTVFKRVQVELFSKTFIKSDSPHHLNVVEVMEVVNSQGTKPQSPIRIYYGEKGSILKRYKEYDPNRMYTADQIRVNWVDDYHVKVEIMGENEQGAPILEKMIEIEITK